LLSSNIDSIELLLMLLEPLSSTIKRVKVLSFRLNLFNPPPSVPTQITPVESENIDVIELLLILLLSPGSFLKQINLPVFLSNMFIPSPSVPIQIDPGPSSQIEVILSELREKGVAGSENNV